ncbi:MAG: Ig-like domain-containing protein, partial [Planctomycetes bacterium]|nr:Ig-like domain-containing protein [Planctomycetota bacterium]
QVWVAQGTYVPGGARSSTFTIPVGVAVYGGFTGVETALAQRRDDPALVVLSGEIGAPGYADNVTTIVAMAGDGRIDTVTVSGANFVDAVSGNNWYMIGAGGVWIRDGADRVALVRCRFTGNRGHGPAVIFGQRADQVELTRCEVLDSREDAPTASPRPEVATISLMNCNQVLVDGCVVAGVRIAMPAFFLSSRTAAIRASVGSSERIRIENTVVADTDCAVALEGETFGPLVQGCTLVGNVGGVWPFNSTLRGCLLEPPSSTTYTFDYTGTVEGCWFTATQGDPLFADRAAPAGADGVWFTADDGLRLRAGSPCIDRARFITATTATGMPATDILGTARPQGHDPDSGAYEFPVGNAGPTALAQVLTIREDADTVLTLAGSDPDGDDLDVFVASLPNRGWLFPTVDGATIAGPALTAADLPWRVGDPQHRVVFRPARDDFGSNRSQFTFQVDDGAIRSYAATVTVSVESVNDAPVIDPVADRSVAEDSGQVTIVLTGIGAGTPGLPVGDPSREVQVLAVAAASSDPLLVTHPTVSYVSPATTAAISFAPLPDATGTARITVTVRDDGGTDRGGSDTTTISFAVTVRPANDPPTMDPLADLVVAEDAAGAVVQVTGLSPGSAGESGQRLAISATASDPALLAIAGVDYAPGASTAAVRLRLVPDANGQALVFIAAFDDAGAADGGAASVARVCTVTVTPVDDPPVLAALTGLVAVVGRDTAIGPGVLRITDPDRTPAAELRFRVESAPAHGRILLGGAEVVAGGQFAQADIDAGLVAYGSSTAATSDAWSFTWSDGTAPRQGPATMAVALAGAGLPAVTAATAAPTWTEGGPAVTVAGDALVQDPDAVAWEGGSVSVDILAGAVAGDQLALADQGLGAGQVALAADGGVLVGGLAVGTLSATAGATRLVVALAGAAATPAAAQAIVRAVRFRHAGQDPGAAPRTLAIVVNDGAAGASAPALVSVPVAPVNDPPAVATTWCAVPAGETVLVRLAANDPDGPAATWSLLAVPGQAEVELVDAAAGLLRVSGRPGAAGSGTLRVQVADGLAAPVAADIQLKVSASGDPRPEPAGELPPDAFAGGEVDAWVRFDTAALGGGAALTFSASADAPAGLVLEAGGPDTVRVRWTIPAATAPGYVRFAVIATDPASRSAGALPVVLLVRAQPRGGG